MDELIDRRNRMDGLKLLRRVPDAYAKLAFFDPQYRAFLGRREYGNQGAKQSARAALLQMTEEVIREFGTELARVARPSGYVCLWGDKFILGSGAAPSFFGGLLQMVDIVVWDCGRINMGYRSRQRGQYLIVFQKPPVKVRATWKTMPCVPDVWLEKVPRDARTHVHQKPIKLLTAIVEATTEKNDVVVDPCAGSFAAMSAARSVGRRFLGCDLRGAAGCFTSSK